MRTVKRWWGLGKGLSGSSAGNVVASTTVKGVHHISEGLMWFGGGLLIVITLLTVSDVFARYFFDSPIPGTIELVKLILVCITFSGMVYTTARKANVQVTVLVSRFPRRAQRILASIMTFIGVVIFALLSWQLGLSAAEWMHIGRHSATLFIPLAPFKFFAAVAAGLICLVLLIRFLHSLGKQD